MHITLPKKMEEIVNEHVQSGLYASVSEVMRDALRVWLEHKSSRGIELEKLRAKVDASLGQLDRGEGEPFTRKTVENIERRGLEKLRTSN
jgi:antitoxin ParD1/3/4